MNREIHKQLIGQYISSGGNPEKIKAFQDFSTANHAKLKYFIKQLGETPEPIISVSDENPKETVPAEHKKQSIFSDLISNYPQELHIAYKQRYDYWLEACSLKIQLNAVDHGDEKTAYEIQNKMFAALDQLDKCQNALDHYKEYKRVLPIETKVDYGSLSPMELITTRNNLRSNITKRKSTISKMEASLPKTSHPNYKRDLHLLNRKKEQLQEYENRVEQLNNLINE
ncbi:hypothetical protein [Elizabethkingia anophelis]|uniref:hypothetical protein n=1 Tax=Elizabethkingia anophelis TaxID=1117645 RepID=UPI000442CD21|nr:hypothetical protein [Elizabethkingia anophelis]CDN79533.1 conserved hypothetical protein [Elizabethkingia anophelis]